MAVRLRANERYRSDCFWFTAFDFWSVDALGGLVQIGLNTCHDGRINANFSLN